MKMAQSRLGTALLLVSLSLLAYYGTILISGPLAFIYRGAAGLSTASRVALYAAGLASAALCVAAGIVAVNTALRPAGLFARLLNVLPLFCLLVLLVGVASALAGVGTTGAMLSVPLFGRLSFAAAWLTVAGVAAVVATFVAAATSSLGSRAVRAAMTAVAVSGVPALVAVIAAIASLAILLTHQPSLARPGAAGVNEAGGQVPVVAQRTAGSAAAVGGSVAAGTPAPGDSGGTLGQGRGGAAGGGPEGQAPEGRGPAGGFANPATMVARFGIGTGLMALFAVLGAVSIGGSRRALAGLAAGGQAALTGAASGREAGLALLSLVVVAVMVLAAIQLIPVAQTNPPAQTALQWDSPQTQDLATRACMDCHSNQTRWPWYTNIAPASWLTVSHVDAGRQQLNLSNLATLSANRRSNLANQMAEQIRNGSMPLKDYIMIHADAALTDAEKQQLIQGLAKTLAQTP